MIGPASIPQVADLESQVLIKFRASSLRLLLIKLLLYVLRVHCLQVQSRHTIGCLPISSFILRSVIFIRESLRLLKLASVADILHQLLPRTLIV